MNQTNIIITVVTRATQCMEEKHFLIAKGGGCCRVGNHQMKEICCVIVEAFNEDVNSRSIYICYSPAGRSVLGKTVPEVLDTARGRRPRAVLKTEGTVFPNTDRPKLVNNIFIFFYNTTKGVRKTRTF